jgi:putative ABC transport system permease protein
MKLRAFLTRFAGLFPSRGQEQDRAAELEAHLEMQIDDNLRSGMTAEQARREAILKLGNLESGKQAYREASTLPFIETLLQDLRFAARQLARNKGFAITAVLILALGIGASTAIFSAVNPILFAPLPYPNPSRIMMIWDIYQDARSDVTFHTYRELAERNHAFEALAVMEAWQPTMTGPAEPVRFDGQRVSASYFRVLGVKPALSRDFEPADDVFKGPRVAILSDKLWREQFGADLAILGRPIVLDGNAVTVIGVMPRGFDNVLAPSAELWAPLQYNSGNITDRESQEWGHHLHMAGRLRRGVGRDQARIELNQIAHQPVAEFSRVPWADLKHGFIVDSLQREITRGVRPVLLAVFGAVLLLLAIACVNVTNLLLARGTQRRGEFAVRAAMGAGRRRLVRQLLTESLLLSALGGIFGIVVAKFGVRALIALSPADLPRLAAFGLDPTVLVFAIGITTLAGVLVGLVPATQASRSDLQGSLQQSSRRTSHQQHWMRGTLVVTEVALALVLLVSAGLLLRSLERLFAIAPGFDSSHVLTMQVQTAGRRYDDPAARQRFFAQALEGAQRVPGVQSAAFTSLLPLSGDTTGSYGAQFESGGNYDVSRYAVTPEYFAAMGIAVRKGRLLDAHDDASAPPAVLISESLAKAEYRDRDPIGQRVHIGPTNRPWFVVAGVVTDVKQASLAEINPRAVYITPAQSWFADDAMSLVVRSRAGDPASLAPALKQAVWAVDKDQPIVRVISMEALLAASEAQRRFALIAFELFALVGMVLAATGIYGVLSGSVSDRLHEIGIRIALGASQHDILGLVVRQGMKLTGLGVALGLVGAVLATEALLSLLFGVSRLDPLTYAGVIALLAAVSAVACGLPAWRAAQVDPATTLRAE